MTTLISKGLLVAGLVLASQAARAIDTSAAEALYAKRGDSATALQNARDAYTNLLPQATGAEIVTVVEKLSRLDYLEAITLAQQPGNNDPALKVIYQRCLDNLNKIAPSVSGETPEYYYWKATCLGGWAQANGILVSLQKTGELFTYLDKGVTIDPTYEGGGFYRVQGRAYQKLPAINIFGPAKDLAQSKLLLEKAIGSPAYTRSAHPDLDKGAYHYSVYEYLSDTLIELNQSAQAKQVLDEALQNYEDGYVNPDQVPETAIDIARLKAARAKLGH